MIVGQLKRQIDFYHMLVLNQIILVSHHILMQCGKVWKHHGQDKTPEEAVSDVETELRANLGKDIIIR